MDLFSKKSVKALQAYLKERAVVTAGYLKAGLVELCAAAHELGIEIDPDGLVEDRHEVIQDKLKTNFGELMLPTLLTDYSAELWILPRISIFDIYSYLIRFSDHDHGYDHASFRDIQKMEAFSMAKDGYVRESTICQYKEHHRDFFAVQSKVKPRTQERDPLTKLKTYSVWIIIQADTEAMVHSALCMCKGG